MHGKKALNESLKKVHVSNLSKVKTQVARENPSTQKSITKSSNTPVGLINKIIPRFTI